MINVRALLLYELHFVFVAILILLDCIEIYDMCSSELVAKNGTVGCKDIVNETTAYISSLILCFIAIFFTVIFAMIETFNLRDPFSKTHIVKRLVLFCLWSAITVVPYIPFKIAWSQFSQFSHQLLVIDGAQLLITLSTFFTYVANLHCLCLGKKNKNDVNRLQRQILVDMISNEIDYCRDRNEALFLHVREQREHMGALVTVTM